MMLRMPRPGARAVPSLSHLGDRVEARRGVRKRGDTVRLRTPRLQRGGRELPQLSLLERAGHTAPAGAVAQGPLGDSEPFGRGVKTQDAAGRLQLHTLLLLAGEMRRKRRSKRAGAGERAGK